MCVLINCATGRGNREDVTARLANASMNDTYSVQLSMLRSNTLSSALFSVILVSTVSINLYEAFIGLPSTLAVPVMQRSEVAFLTASSAAWRERL